MPTYTDMTRCDGCGECVDICPSDIMHIDPVYRRSYNVEPNFCWECYSCVKYCPQHAIDVRGYADFAPLGHKVRVRRDVDKGVIAWKIRYRDGREKAFSFPIRTTAWGSIRPPADYAPPGRHELDSPLLAHEPEALNIAALPSLSTPNEKV
ncbi:MAG: adenylyl-sulfate reductase subunit beta [Gammaproteobacteria bacterium]|nr:adenylyl-sulfate reductase subunit beta [Gammaproteobacteria bacterium]